MNIKKIIKLFEQGNVSVCGMRGTGKDMLFANVISRRRSPYISNTNYQAKRSPYIRLELDKLNVKNNWKNFCFDDIIEYNYPYPEKCDIYVSDCGIYFPSQYCNELNKAFPEIAVFSALSRQLGNANFHTNCQAINRVYDKLREQSETYVYCRSCKVLGNIVFQKVTIYDKVQSCIDKVEPYKHIPVPIFATKELKANLRMKDEEMKRNFKQNYGNVKTVTLIYKNQSNYDTRLFKGVLSRGKKAKTPFKDILRNALEKTKNVLKVLLKPLKFICPFLLGIMIVTAQPCSRSPTKANAYSYVGYNQDYYSFSTSSPIYYYEINNSSLKNGLLASFYVDKRNDRLYFPISSTSYDFIELSNVVIGSSELALMSNVVTDSSIFVASFVYDVHIDTFLDCHFAMFQRINNTTMYLSFYQDYTGPSSPRVGYISFEFTNVTMSALSTSVSSLNGIPNSLSYNAGFQKGYSEGYDVGVNTKWKDISPFQVISNGIDEFFDTPLFGTSLKIGHILQIGFGIILLGFIIKVFLGG